jgi:hypothetical protein
MFRLNIYIYKVKWNVLVIIIITRRIALPIQSFFFFFGKLWAIMNLNY